MLPVFVQPLAFLGLLALPALVAIYILRNRHRPQVVSSLMLWIDPHEARAGGSRIRRLHTPLLLLLELLLILLLVLASAGPYVPRSESARPLVVILDDSFSMRAGGDDSARHQAIRALEEELHRADRSSIRFVLAGERPTLLGEVARTSGERSRLLAGWRCQSPTANLEAALSLGAEIGGDLALLLVLTDQKPQREPDRGRVQWWAFGQDRPNLALVSAARTARDGADRCLLEVANFSRKEQTPTLIVTADRGGVEVHRSSLRLDPRGSHRVVLQLPEGTPALHARIGDDELSLDNEVDLLPSSVRKVRVALRVASADLRPLIDRAVRATGIALPGGARPHLVITDASEVPDEEEAWVLQVKAEKEAEAYVGPFILDRTHPLSEGLSLQGVIWGAGKSPIQAGPPVILAGNVPLLTDAEGAAGRHVLRLRLRPDLSTLQDSPGWPVLFSNLLQWHASQQPGLTRPNVRLGEDAVLTFASAPQNVRLVAPDGEARTLPVQDRRVIVRAEQVGIHQIQFGEEKVLFAVNALHREESDLGDCVSGRWGNWLDETSLRLEYVSIAWLFLLLALTAASLHMALVAREARLQRRSARRSEVSN